MSERNNDEINDPYGVLMVFIFIILLILKAAGMDISWWIVTAPITIPVAYITLRDAFSKK